MRTYLQIHPFIRDKLSPAVQYPDLSLAFILLIELNSSLSRKWIGVRKGQLSVSDTPPFSDLEFHFVSTAPSVVFPGRGLNAYPRNSSVQVGLTSFHTNQVRRQDTRVLRTRI